MRSSSPNALLLSLVVLAAACGGDDEPPQPLFPADYAAAYTQVRNCRGSGDHELHNIRVLADPAALGPYQDRVSPFPEGAVVLKEEHDFADIDCSQPPVAWTVMVRLAAGSSPDTIDWRWQYVEADRRVSSQDEPRCINCHADCGVPPDGYEGTCTMPP